MRRPIIRRVRDWEPSRAPRQVAIDDDDEADKATLARFVPIDSEVCALFDDPEKTLAYIRKVRASIPDPDSALDSLVAVYEDRVARHEKDRAHGAAIVAQAHVAPRREEKRARPKKQVTLSRSDRVLVKLQPHLWKVVYSTICVWGLVQLALTR